MPHYFLCNELVGLIIFGTRSRTAMPLESFIYNQAFLNFYTRNKAIPMHPAIRYLRLFTYFQLHCALLSAPKGSRINGNAIQYSKEK